MPLDFLLEQTIASNVASALAEDVGSGDITARLIDVNAVARATIITREQAVLCGIAWVNEVFRQLDPNIELHWRVADGDHIHPDQTLCELTGNARALLTGERAALNFLQTLSGTATVARDYAQRVAGSGIRVLDTRKTLPGLRLAQKYAVKIGGCDNHRLGLYDAFLIKENHIAACGGIPQAIARARQIAPGKPVEVEVENLDECRAALDAGVERIMLDNFTPAQIEAAVTLRKTFGRDPGGRDPSGREPRRDVRSEPGQNTTTEFEVSGNIDNHSLASYQANGVDFISSGAITKHCRAVDFSLRITG